MEDNKVIKVGDAVPDFTLKDQNEKEIKLSELRGKRVLLSFHPMAWTGVCTDQMRSLEDKYDEFEKHNTVPLGISVDTVPTKKAWADDMGIQKTSLLSDFWPHGDVARSLGLFKEKSGISERANVLIDETGVVESVRVYPIKDLPDLQEILDHIREVERD
jgi:peroxiredoxin